VFDSKQQWLCLQRTAFNGQYRMTSWMFGRESIQGACGSRTLRVSLLTRDFATKVTSTRSFSLLRAGAAKYLRRIPFQLHR
jgi:hypothetical protein